MRNKLKMNGRRHRWPNEVCVAVFDACDWRCVLCDRRATRRRRWSLEAGHLDEDRTSEHIADLIPLCKPCNTEIFHLRSIDEAPRQLRPEGIFARAQELSLENLHLASHLCYKQGAHILCTRRRDIAGQLEFLIHSVGAIRPISGGDGSRWPVALGEHIRRGAHLRQVLLQIRDIFRQSSRGFEWQRAEFLSTLGLVLEEHKRFDMSSKCSVEAYGLKERLLARSGPLRRPRQVECEWDRENRRLLFTLLPNRHNHRQLYDRAYEHVAKGVTILEECGQYRQAATHNDVLGLNESRQSGPGSPLVYESTRRGLRFSDRIGNDWVKGQLQVQLGLHLVAGTTQGDARNRTRLKEEAEFYLREGMTSLFHHRIIPQPDIGAQLTVQRACELIGVTDIPSIAPRGRFPLSSQELGQVLKAAAGRVI